MAAATDKSVTLQPIRFTVETLTPKLIFLGFAALFLLNLLLRVFYLRYQFVNGDEGVRALTAASLLDGARLYADIVTDKPPATSYFYAAVFALFGRRMEAVHLAAAVWNFFTSILVFKTAAVVYNRRAGLLAALLFIYFSTNYFTQDMMAANTELLMLLPYVAAFYFYLRSLPSAKGHSQPPEPQTTTGDFRTAAKYLFAAGVLTGLAVMFKQLAAFNLLFFVACELFLIYRDRPDAPLPRLFGRSFTRLLLLAAGVLAVVAALVLWLYRSGTLADFWRYVFVLNTFYIDSLSTDLWLKFMVKRIFGYVGFNLALWALAVWTVLRAFAVLLAERQRVRQAQGSLTGDPQSFLHLNREFAVILWAVVSLVAVFTSGRFFGHYFIQSLPALAILAARGLEILFERWQTPAFRPKAKATAILLLVVFGFGLVRIHHRTAILAFETLSGHRTRFSARWGMTKREQEAAMVSKKVLARINPGEPLYIWDYALDIYWRTGCRPASRFITPNHLTGDFTDAETGEDYGQGTFWKQNRRLLLEDLRRNQPRIILDPTGGIQYLPYAEIVEFVEQNYERDGELGLDPARPFVVYKLKGS